MRPVGEKEQQRNEGRSLKLYGASIKVGKKSSGEVSWKATSDLCFMAVTLALFLKCVRG